MLILFSGKVSVLILVLDDCYRCRAPLYRAASNVKNGHNTSDKHVLLPPPPPSNPYHHSYEMALIL